MIKYNDNSLFYGEKMAKPRIFVSSTYYDLKYIRANLEQFIRDFGYEPVLFENGDIFFKHGKALDESCYEEISHAHMLILIIGGSYGSKSSDTPENGSIEHINNRDMKPLKKQREEYESITLKEYDEARNLNLPVFVFVDSQVLSEFETYKKNKNNDRIEYAHVTNIGIFKLIENIRNQKKSNLFTKGFDKFDDIASWLRDQWAAMFADYLKQARDLEESKLLKSKIAEIDSLLNRVKIYSEETMKFVMKDDLNRSNDIISEAERNSKLLEFENNRLVSYIMRYELMEREKHQEPINLTHLINEILEKIKISDTIEKLFSNFTRLRNLYSHGSISDEMIQDFKNAKELSKYL